jgi:hypothetical protein
MKNFRIVLNPEARNVDEDTEERIAPPLRCRPSSRRPSATTTMPSPGWSSHLGENPNNIDLEIIRYAMTDMRDQLPAR